MSTYSIILHVYQVAKILQGSFYKDGILELVYEKVAYNPKDLFTSFVSNCNKT